jgi:hypothetical protein
MAGNPKIIVDFVSDTSGLTTGFAKAESGSSKFAASLKSVGKTGALAAGAAGVGALIYTIKTGIGEWQESQKVTAQTEAVIKSTGSAAQVTAQHVAELAESIMKKTGIDDEAVQSGENMLLTFTAIRNEVGKGNDIFDQATVAITDMSVALGQDMQTSAIQLGKALQDPVKGMTALRRVGVGFTEEQQKQVKAMVESGHTMEAQKVILAELTREFGGSSEAIGKTLPGKLAIAREAFKNFAGDMVEKVIPYVERLINYLQKNWPAISQSLLKTWDDLKPTVEAFGKTISSLGEVFVAVFDLIHNNWSLIAPFINGVANEVKAALVVIGDALRLVAALLRGDWSAAWKEFKNLVVDEMKLIGAEILNRTVAIRVAFTALWPVLQAGAAAAWNAIRTTVVAAWTAITTATTTALNAVKLAVTTGWTAIRTAVQVAMAAVTTVVTAGWNAIKTVITTAMGAVRAAIMTAWSAIQTAVSSAQNALRAAITAAWNGIKAVITAAVGPITAAVTSIGKAFRIPADAAQAMLAAVRSAVGAIPGVITGVIGAVSNAAQKLADAMLRPINAAKGAINAVLGRFNALRIPGFSVGVNMPGPIPDIDFSWGGMDLPDIPLLAKGGIISKPTLAMVGEAGPEAVVPLSAAGAPIEVRVFIGDQELRGLVRTEIVDSNTGIARTLLAGARR